MHDAHYVPNRNVMLLCKCMLNMHTCTCTCTCMYVYMSCTVHSSCSAAWALQLLRWKYSDRSLYFRECTVCTFVYSIQDTLIQTCCLATSNIICTYSVYVHVYVQVYTFYMYTCTYTCTFIFPSHLVSISC